jgi:hypothetical protein
VIAGAMSMVRFMYLLHLLIGTFLKYGLLLRRITLASGFPIYLLYIVRVFCND